MTPLLVQAFVLPLQKLTLSLILSYESSLLFLLPLQCCPRGQCETFGDELLPLEDLRLEIRER